MSVLDLPVCPICLARDSLSRKTMDQQEQSWVWYECQECRSALLWIGDDQWAYQKVTREDKASLLKKPMTARELQDLLPLPEEAPADSSLETPVADWELKDWSWVGEDTLATKAATPVTGLDLQDWPDLQEGASETNEEASVADWGNQEWLPLKEDALEAKGEASVADWDNQDWLPLKEDALTIETETPMADWRLQDWSQLGGDTPPISTEAPPADLAVEGWPPSVQDLAPSSAQAPVADTVQEDWLQLREELADQPAEGEWTASIPEAHKGNPLFGKVILWLAVLCLVSLLALVGIIAYQFLTGSLPF
jgi:hypothetical protein